MENAAAESRASALLDRLETLGLGDGMAEPDLLGGAVREPLRKCCMGLFDQLWAVQRSGHGTSDVGALHGAIVAAQEGNGMRRGATEEFEESLRHIVLALGVATPASYEPSRLDCLEAVVSAVQAGAIELAVAPAPVVQPSATNVDQPHAPEISQALREMALLLQLPQAQLTAAAQVAALRERSTGLLMRLPPALFDAVVPPGLLSESELEQLHTIDAALHDEYLLRRRMLQERVTVTLQTFMSSQRLEAGEATRSVQAVAGLIGGGLPAHCNNMEERARCATLGDLLAVTQRSGQEGRGAVQVKGVLIGAVPDRGGRRQGRARAADMPIWKGRRSAVGSK